MDKVTVVASALPESIVITIQAADAGRFEARYQGEPLTTSRQPFLDGARILIKRDLDPKARYVMRREGSERDDLISTLGVAAGLRVTGTPEVESAEHSTE